MFLENVLFTQTGNKNAPDFRTGTQPGIWLLCHVSPGACQHLSPRLTMWLGLSTHHNSVLVRSCLSWLGVWNQHSWAVPRSLVSSAHVCGVMCVSHTLCRWDLDKQAIPYFAFEAGIASTLYKSCN